jgi:hypothetical protein
MDHGADVQLDQCKITFQVGFQERITNTATGIQRQDVDRPATLLDR